MTEESNKKINFFKDIIKSIKDFDKYEDFAVARPADTIKYLLKVILIFCAIICIAYTYKIVSNMNNLYLGLKDKIPNFSYEEEILKIESDKPIVIEDYGEVIGTIIFDTNEETDEIYDKYYEKNIKKYGTGFVFTKDSLIMFNSQINGQLSYKYSDLLQNYGISNLTKETAIKEIESVSSISISLSIYFMIFIYLYILYFINIMIDILILSLFAYFIARLSRIKLKMTPSFNIAVHSITLPIILNMIYIIVNLLIGFEIKYFQIMYNTISYIYVIVAILMIKTDFISRQAELIKIAQEQMKVKEELKKQEEKQKEELDNKKDEKENDDKESKEDSTKKRKSKSNESSGDPIGDASIVSDEK